MPYFNQHGLITQNSPYEIFAPTISSQTVFDGTYYLLYTLKGAVDAPILFKVDITDMITSTNRPSSEYSNIEVIMVNSWEWDNQIQSETNTYNFGDKNNITFDLAQDPNMPSVFSFSALYQDMEGLRSPSSNTINLKLIDTYPALFFTGSIPTYDAQQGRYYDFPVVDGPMAIPGIYTPTYTVEASDDGNVWYTMTNSEPSIFDETGLTLVNLGSVNPNIQMIRLNISYPANFVYRFNIGVNYIDMGY